jgi:hypothetical protein
LYPGATQRASDWGVLKDICNKIRTTNGKTKIKSDSVVGENRNFLIIEGKGGVHPVIPEMEPVPVLLSDR